jgi:hypothetical protein
VTRPAGSDLKAIQEATGAGTGDRCQELNPKGVCCIPDIKAILKAETGSADGGPGRCPCCSEDDGSHMQGCGEATLQ